VVGWEEIDAKRLDQTSTSALPSTLLPVKSSQSEVWQRFAGTWATGATGQKPCATTAQPLLILHGFLTHSLD
jgi:hypothetical protein